MTMSDRVAILNNGDLQQIDTPEVVYSQPANRFVAGFIGSPSMNFLDCRIDSAAGAVQTDAFAIDAPSGFSGEAATLGVRPEELSIVPPREGDFSAEVTVFEQIGAYNIIHLAVDDLDEGIVAQVDGSKHFDPGDTVGVDIDPKYVHLFDAADEAVYNPPLASEESTAIA